MTRNQRIAEEIARSWFNGHEASISSTSAVIDWRKPGTVIYGVKYHIVGNQLIVTGDIGAAVYRWSEALTWKFLAGCDFGYFASKCEASERGRDFRTWDEQVALQGLDELISDCASNDRPIDERDQRDMRRACVDENEWIEWLRDSGNLVLGDDWYEYAGIGKALDWRCIGHLVGIKMACEKLGIVEPQTAVSQ